MCEAQQGLLIIQTVIQKFNVVLKTEHPSIVYSSEVLVKLIQVIMIK